MTKGLTLLEVIVIVLVIGILAALLIPSTSCGHRDPTLRCSSNLNQLYKLAQIYSSQHKGQWPVETGEKFWSTLKKSNPPLIDEDWVDLLLCCPVKADSEPGEVDYRGPAAKFAQAKDGDPIGADKEGNHDPERGGCVLRKSGDVQVVERSDRLWAECRVKLLP